MKPGSQLSVLHSPELHIPLQHCADGPHNWAVPLDATQQLLPSASATHFSPHGTSPATHVACGGAVGKQPFASDVHMPAQHWEPFEHRLPCPSGPRQQTASTPPDRHCPP